MPNPKYYVDSNYQYVRGYVRRRRTPAYRQGGTGAVLLLAILALFFWKVIVGILIILAGIVALIATVKWATWSRPRWIAFIPLPVWALVTFLVVRFILRGQI